MSFPQGREPPVPFEKLGELPMYDWDVNRGGRGAVMLGSARFAMQGYTPERRRETLEAVVRYLRGERGAKLPPEAKERSFLAPEQLGDFDLEFIASGNGPKITETATIFFVGRRKGAARPGPDDPSSTDEDYYTSDSD